MNMTFRSSLLFLLYFRGINIFLFILCHDYIYCTQSIGSYYYGKFLVVLLERRRCPSIICGYKKFPEHLEYGGYSAEGSYTHSTVSF